MSWVGAATIHRRIPPIIDPGDDQPVGTRYLMPTRTPSSSPPVTNPNQIIDPAGFTTGRDSTAGLQAWFDALPDGTGLNNMTVVVAPANAKYLIEGDLGVGKQYLAIVGQSTSDKVEFGQSTIFAYRAQPAPSNKRGQIACNWFDLNGGETAGDISRVGWDGECSGNTLTIEHFWFIAPWSSAGVSYQANVTVGSITRSREVSHAGHLWRANSTHTSNAGNAPGTGPWTDLGVDPGGAQIEIWDLTFGDLPFSGITVANTDGTHCTLTGPNGTFPDSVIGGQIQGLSTLSGSVTSINGARSVATCLGHSTSPGTNKAFRIGTPGIFRDGTDFPSWTTAITPGRLFLITAYSADGKTVTLNGTPHLSAVDPVNHPNQDRFWAIMPKLDWERVFLPNPNYFPTLKTSGPGKYTGNKATGTAAQRALAGSGSNPTMRPPIVFGVGGNHCWFKNVRVRGSNTNWSAYNDNRESSDPLEAENFPGFVMGPTTHDNVLDHVEVVNIWGTALSIDGHHHWVHHSLFHRAGRQAMDTGWSWACIMEDCVLHSNRHSHVDFEPNGDAPLSVAHRAGEPAGAVPVHAVDWWVVQRCVFGTGAGGSGGETIAASSAHGVSRLRWEDNQSRTSHVVAGIIPALSEMTTSIFGPPKATSPQSGYIVWRGNGTDKTTGTFTFRRLTHVLYEGNDRDALVGGGGTEEGAFKGLVLSNYKSRNNLNNGSLDPKQYEATANPTSFVDLSNPAATNWWWRAGAPDPVIERRH